MKVVGHQIDSVQALGQGRDVIGLQQNSVKVNALCNFNTIATLCMTFLLAATAAMSTRPFASQAVRISDARREKLSLSRGFTFSSS